MLRQNIGVGVNVFLIKDNRLLLGKRKNVYGDGSWGLPGGHLENKERADQAAVRELDEETGLKAIKLKFVNCVNQPSRENHYVHINFLAESFAGELTNKEPDKCYEWKWFHINELPDNLFVGHEAIIMAFKNNILFVDD